MLTIEKTVLPSPEQWEIIIEGMRNPKNSWDRIDSSFDCSFDLGDNDHSLMGTLADGGPVHAKYRRMIPVYVTINAPLYWWKEFDTYKVGTVCNSCSTMHKIHSNEFTLNDFSSDHMTTITSNILKLIIKDLNYHRAKFVAYKDKRHWWQLIQLLPTSYNQRRTIMLNYEVLTNIYKWRRNHKLDEWHTFCDWILHLPHSDLIIGD